MAYLLRYINRTIAHQTLRRTWAGVSSALAVTILLSSASAEVTVPMTFKEIRHTFDYGPTVGSAKQLFQSPHDYLSGVDIFWVPGVGEDRLSIALRLSTASGKLLSEHLADLPGNQGANWYRGFRFSPIPNSHGKSFVLELVPLQGMLFLPVFVQGDRTGSFVQPDGLQRPGASLNFRLHQSVRPFTMVRQIVGQAPITAASGAASLGLLGVGVWAMLGRGNAPLRRLFGLAWLDLRWLTPAAIVVAGRMLFLATPAILA